MTTPTSPLFQAPLLVGRKREQAMLRAHLDEALAGHGSLVLIGGEAGIGKTALAEAVCREAAERKALVLVGRCYDLTETPPYSPWIELFGSYLPGNDLPALPAPFAQRGTIGDVTSQAAFFFMVQDFFTALTAHGPLLLILDDLHWADPASLDLLRFLARAVAHLPLLVLVTYRVDELTRRHPLYTLLPLLEHESGAVRLDLRRLSADDVRTLVEARYHLTKADANRLVGYLHARADGNVFFTIQLLRALEEREVLRSGDDGWVVGDLDRLHVPLALRQVIDGRLARLGEEAQRLLGVAAVIGHEVPLSLWAAVAERDEEELLALVERAARVLVETPDGVGVRFEHALVREAVYEGLSPARRRLLHRQIGERLTTRANPDPDAVAMHFQRAGDGQAVPWLVRAGERAQVVYAWLTAAARFETALTLMDATTDTASDRGWLLVRLAWLRRFADQHAGIAALEHASQLASDAHDPVLAGFALFLQGILRCRVEDYRRGLVELAAGVVAIDALPAAERGRPRAFDDVSGTSDQESRWSSLALWLACAGRFTEARATAERALPRESGGPQDRFLLTDAHYALGIVRAAMGQPDEARQAFAQGRDMFRTMQHHVGIGQSALTELEWVALPYYADQVVERRALAATAVEAWTVASGALQGDDPVRLPELPLLLLEGHWREACDVALAIRAASRGSVRRLMATRILGELAHQQGEQDCAWALIREWLPANRDLEPGDMRFLDTLVLFRLAVTLAIDASDLTMASAWLRRYGTWLAWSGAVLGQAEEHLLWAQYHRAAGDIERANEHAKLALTHASEPRQPLALIAAHRLLGELDTGAGRYDDADRHLDTSLALADACRAPYERALTLLAMAALHVAMNQHGDPRPLLDEVRALCMPLQATPALARADALTQRLDELSSAAAAAPTGLTAREIEVLRLLASGQTIKQIAADLFLSPRTVERHITTIYRKIGARGRVDATAYALHRGLTPSPHTT